MIWLRYLLSIVLGPADTIEGWTPARAHQAERQTLAALGYVVEPHYAWSRKFRPFRKAGER